jgi:pimeloyl-ACP methyl ester carboxylesterase
MRRFCRRLRALPLLAAVLAAACDDLPDGNPLIGPGNAGASATWQPDPAINPADTYYLAEVYQEGSTTIQSQTPITDPVTGAVGYQFTARHEPETQRVEGGYDSYGRIIQVLDQTDAMADPLLVPVNSTRRSRSVADAITRYDENRQVVPNETVYITGVEGGPSHEQITDGLVLDAAAVDALPELSAAAEPLAGAAGPRASVRRSGPGEIQIANDIPPESFAVGAGGEDEPRQVQARAVRTYAARGQRYILERVEVTVDRQAAGARIRERQESRVRLLRYHQNPAQDRARRDRRRGRPVPGEMEPQGGGCISPTSAGVITVATCEPPPDELPPPDQPPPADPCPQVNTGVTVLFQHGFASGGSTWDRMDGWVRCEFQTGLHIRPSLNWFVSIPEQRDALRPYLPTYGNGTVLVGHSNGGLVARSLAQWAQMNLPGRVRGVVTLDSPNQGAIVAVNMQVLEHVIGSTVFGIQWPAIDLLAWHPVWEDDTPFSPFIARTNGFDETFTRVGIQTHMPKRWSLARMAWSAASSCVPESPCGERAVKRRIQEEYDRHRHYARFWYRPWQSIPAAASMLTMNSLDALWNGFTAPFALPSDGFIHGPGQVYPRALRNRLILDGDSHTGTTRSLLVRDEVFAALAARDLFAIPRRCESAC